MVIRYLDLGAAFCYPLRLKPARFLSGSIFIDRFLTDIHGAASVEDVGLLPELQAECSAARIRPLSSQANKAQAGVFDSITRRTPSRHRHICAFIMPPGAERSEINHSAKVMKVTSRCPKILIRVIVSPDLFDRASACSSSSGERASSDSRRLFFAGSTALSRRDTFGAMVSEYTVAVSSISSEMG